MMKIKRSFDLCDFLQEQSFLEQMHREGKRLIAKSKTTFIFEECIPDEYVYRMECINTKSESDIDFISAYSQMGWELAETAAQRSLLFIKTGFTWYYFCKKKSNVESENELTAVSHRLVICAVISRWINIEFSGLIIFTALINILGLPRDGANFVYDFFYVVLTLGIIGLTWRYLKINFGMTSKIKQLLSIYR